MNSNIHASDNLKMLGIVGGIASGKSLVSAAFEQLGAVVFNADQIGHLVLRESEVILAIKNRWGNDVLDAAGEVNRAAVAAIVFAKDGWKEKEFLEKLTHPRIGERLQQQLLGLEKSAAPMVVLDAALLFEAGWNSLCDAIVFVDVPREVRLKRALARGWSEADFAAREAWQWPVEEKLRRADYVIDNSGDFACLAEQVARIWDGMTPATSKAGKPLPKPRL